MTKWKRTFILLALLALLVTGGAFVAAQTGGVYSLTWSTADGGGGSVSGGSYTLGGTAGQPDASSVSGGSYALIGGFWGAGGPTSYTVFLPAILR
ncbi:MAG: hypothetical protein ACE5E7_11980 [Anaerolineae bacterium]